jgi:hypothetical protein
MTLFSFVLIENLKVCTVCYLRVLPHQLVGGVCSMEEISAYFLGPLTHRSGGLQIQMKLQSEFLGGRIGLPCSRVTEVNNFVAPLQRCFTYGCPNVPSPMITELQTVACRE